VLKTFSKGGVHPAENKISAGVSIEKLPLPKTVYIPISQHIGAPAAAVVNKGDKVKAGQIIAKSAGFVSANIHSSVSGTVEKIDDIMDSSGYKRKAIIINVEGDEWLEGIDLTSEIKKEIKLSAEEIITKVSESGIVGLGGATFPSHVKLSVPKGKKAECLIINGVECEPYLTSDHRVMLEKAEEILVGTQILMRALNVSVAHIGIENNKPDAIKHLTELSSKYQGIKIVPLYVKYPQGGEKQLIKAAINREVPSGALPIDVGAVVHNVGTALAVYEAVQKNKPLVERVVTLTGKKMGKTANYMVRIGTPISFLIEHAGGLPEHTGKVVNGGPMMGKALNELDVPVTKGTSGILVFEEKESKRSEIVNCIRCAKCVSVCPMGLEPFLLMSLTERTMWEEVEKEKITDCMECGSCSFTCPACRPLLDYIRLGKSTVIKLIRSRQN
jgi:electron transport complex protein RnfC